MKECSAYGVIDQGGNRLEEANVYEEIDQSGAKWEEAHIYELPQWLFIADKASFLGTLPRFELISDVKL